MSQTLRLLLAALFAAAAVLFATPPVAQETPTVGQAVSAGSETTPGLTLAEVEAALAAIESDAGIEAAAKAPLRSTYKQAIEALKEAADLAAKATDYRKAIKTAPEKTAELRARLKALPSAERAAKLARASRPDNFRRDIDAQRAALDELNDSLSRTKNELDRLEGRPVQISARLPDVQRELSEIRRELASPRLAEDATSPSRVADRILLQARQSRLLSESEMLQQEQISLSVREDLLQARQELLNGEVENAVAALGVLEALADERLAREAQRVGALAEAAPDVPEGDQAAQALAAEVQALGKEFENVVRNLKQVKSAQEDLMSRFARLTDQHEGIQEQLALGGGGRGMAQVLLDMQRRSPQHVAYAEALAAQVVPLDETRLASLQVRVKRRSQPEIESQFADHPSAAVATLVTTRREVLEQLRTQYGDLTRALAAFEAQKKQYLNKAAEIRAYASEQLFGFGMRSAPPLSVNTLTNIPDGLTWFFQGEHWVEFARALWGTGARMPVLSAAILLVAAVLLLTRRRIGKALKQTGPKTHRASTDRYAYTGQALFWTFLLAVPIPLLIGFTGWALNQNPDSGAWMRGIAEGLEVAAWITLVLAFLAALGRRGGLGTVHFRWQENSLARFRQAARWFAAVYVPALLLTYGGLYEEASDYLFSVGRISFMLAHVWMAILLWRLLRFSDGILAAAIREEPSSFVARWRYLWFPLGVLSPIALVVIAWLGYMMTALQLSIGLLQTAALIAGGVVFYRLARRWFRIKQRRLALTEALEKRRARQEAAASPEQQQSGDLVSVDVEAEEELDLVTIDEQTRDMLRLFFGLGTALAILFVWSQNFPVITTFDAVPIPLAGGLTLLGLAKAVLIVVVTYIAARNLPGLLQLAVLRTTTIEAGTRHAISTLSQYALIAIGLTALFNVLNVDWAKLGWIAAALSVGIGFGLQEVVANFVCGLIVLFERPIRVGDVVTVSGTTGTVTKIRIRATTITTGDRQDFVVPNKTLITSSILNWTLTAKLNRVIIRLRVASGSDTEKARQILLDVAADHPLILENPAPVATFEQFGASSLDLVLYAFLPDLANRTSTITELHTEINKRFAAAGIEIPNPQFDLHLHSEGEGGRAAVPAAT